MKSFFKSSPAVVHRETPTGNHLGRSQKNSGVFS